MFSKHKKDEYLSKGTEPIPATGAAKGGINMVKGGCMPNGHKNAGLSAQITSTYGS
jgi:hypothetical protein